MSEIRATTISDAAGTGPIALTGQSAAKAWVNFNGTGTVAISESFNTSSVTDFAVGRYYCNFTNAMNTTTYGGAAAGRSTGNIGFDSYGSNTTTYVSVGAFNSSGTLEDISSISALVTGDLA